jgi:hypothetical protein
LHFYNIITAAGFISFVSLLPFLIFRKMRRKKNKERELERIHKKADKMESDAEMYNNPDIMGQIGDITSSMKKDFFQGKERSVLVEQLIAWKRFFGFLIEEIRGPSGKEV